MAEFLLSFSLFPALPSWLRLFHHASTPAPLLVLNGDYVRGPFGEVCQVTTGPMTDAEWRAKSLIDFKASEGVRSIRASRTGPPVLPFHQQDLTEVPLKEVFPSAVGVRSTSFRLREGLEAQSHPFLCF